MKNRDSIFQETSSEKIMKSRIAVLGKSKERFFVPTLRVHVLGKDQRSTRLREKGRRGEREILIFTPLSSHPLPLIRAASASLAILRRGSRIGVRDDSIGALRDDSNSRLLVSAANVSTMLFLSTLNPPPLCSPTHLLQLCHESRRC